MSILLSFEYMRKKLIDNLVSDYKFVSHSVIGKSVCDRDIDCLQIGNKSKMVLWVGAFHGMEWLTFFLLLKFLRTLCRDIETSKDICGVSVGNQLQKRGLCVVPCLNPDGVEISTRGSLSAGKYKYFIDQISAGDTSRWQANARGVDLNHNYDAGWEELHQLEIENGITNPGPTRYGGIHSESEPETKFLIKLCEKNNFEHAIAFHSQGEEIYWKYGKNIPENSEVLSKIFAIVSGYKLSSPEGLAVGGGFKDWFISRFNRPAFTVEIGKGRNPILFSQLDSIYEKLEKMMYLSTLV